MGRERIEYVKNVRLLLLITSKLAMHRSRDTREHGFESAVAHLTRPESYSRKSHASTYTNHLYHEP